MNNSISNDGGMGASQMSAGAHSATLKGKITGLEETIKALQEEINFYRKEVQTLRSEKDTLDDTMTRKC